MDEKSDISDGTEIDVEELKEEQSSFKEEQDMDFEMEQDSEEEVKEPIADTNLNEGSMYLLILNKSGDYKDFIGIIVDKNEDYIIISNEYYEEEPSKIRRLKIILDANGLFQLEDGTSIIELLNIDEVNPEEVLKEDDIFKEDEIKLKVTEVEKQFKKYNETEIKEDFISEIINLYNKYDDELLIKKITEIAYSFFDLIKNNKSISDIDRTDVLSFIKSMKNNKDLKLPYFILPIVSLKKKLYQEGDEVFIENDNTTISDMATELVEKYNSMNSDGNGYVKTLEALFKYNSYSNNLDKYGFIVNYEGDVIRECLEDNCSGFKINTQVEYKVDLLKSRKELYRIDRGEKEIYINSEQFNITGLLFIPLNLSNYRLKIDLHNNHFNLYENTKLCKRTYSLIPFRNAFLQNNFNSKTINNDSVKDKYNQELTAYLFDLEENINIDKLSDLLSKALPNNKSIIDSIDKNILKHIYNFEDLEKLLLFYDIKINDLVNTDKNEIIELIKSNIDNYQKTYKKLLKSVIKSLKKVKYITKELDNHDKIKLSREYILRNTNIIERNHLLNKFIKIYCREAKDKTENNNWLYSSKGSEQVLCKHYLYSSKIDKHPEYYDSLKSLFSQSEDGRVSCLNCGHLIDNVDFSLFQGYSDGKVINTTEILDTDDTENISEGNKDIKDNIDRVLKSFSVISKLHHSDTESIVEILSVFNNDKFTDYRFNEINHIKNYYKKLDLKGKDVEKIKKKLIKKYKNYTINFNICLVISFLIFIHIQISNEIYKINKSDMFNLLKYDEKETWKLISINNETSINKKLITYINVQLKSLLKKLYKTISEINPKQDDFEQEFIKTIKYFLQPQFNLYNKIDRFFILNKSTNNLYVKKSWPTYKPIYDNKLVSKINSYISSKDEEMKQYFINNDSLENISLLKDINKIEPKYIEYKLPVSTLIGNPSYKRLYIYSLKLNGKSEIFPILNLLTRKFVDDLNDTNVNDLLTKCHFKDKKFSKIQYNDMKKTILGDISNYEIEKSRDRDNILKFKHINLNNTEYLLLNGVITKYYRYIPAEIFNNSKYEELVKNNSQFLERLFDNYCLNDAGELIVNSIDENILNYYLIDYDVELLKNIPECKKVDITKNEENFIKIMSYLPNKNKLIFNQFNYIEYNEKYSNNDISEYLNYNTNTENRLFKIFNKYVPYSETLKNITNVIIDIKTNKENKKYNGGGEFIDILDRISLKINEDIDNSFENIDNLFNIIITNDKYNKNFIEDNLQIKRFKSIPISGLNNVENTSKILNKLLTDIDNQYIYKRLVDDIYYKISIIKNNKNIKSIKKGLYKLSDTNIDNFNEFLKVNDNLLHNDLFFKRNQTELDKGLKYKGFKQYLHENNQIYFQELYNYIKDFNNNLDKLKGVSNNLLDEELTNKFNKYIFIFIIDKISEYIKELIDEESDIHNTMNDKLNEINNDDINIDNCIIGLTKFLLDLIMNMYEKYYDPTWVYISDDLINKYIMKQVSREKQTYLKKISQMTKEQKYQNDLMNGMGKGTLYKESEKENIKYSESKEHEQMTESERIEIQKEIFMSTDDNMTEQVYKPLETVQEDTGYDYNLGEGDGYDDNQDNDNDYD